MGVEMDRRIELWLGCLVSAVLLLISAGAITGSDGPAMYEVTRSVVEHGDLTVPPALGFLGRGGHSYATHGLGLPLVSIVPYLLTRPIANATSHPQEISEAVVSSIMPLIGGLLAAALYALSRRLGGRVGSSLFVAVGGVAGTFLLVYLKDFYSEPLAALLVVVAIERVLAGRSMTGGVAAAAAALTRPQLFALCPILLWRVWSDRGRRAAIKTAVPIGAAVVLSVAYNVARFGDPLQFDPLQGGIRFPGGLVDGAFGLLFFPRKSILLFAPVAVLLPFSLGVCGRGTAQPRGSSAGTSPSCSSSPPPGPPGTRSWSWCWSPDIPASANPLSSMNSTRCWCHRAGSSHQASSRPVQA